MNATVRHILTVVASSTLFLAQLVHAQAVSPSVLTISENTVQAKLELTPQIAVDLAVEFENAVGLNANSVDISAELLDPSSLTITNRLPGPLVSATGAFPVMVSIEPKADKGFAFEGVAVVELYTKALHYTPGTPLRLFRSHNNGPFEDITLLTASGSFRARGNTGGFSDFIILLDNRPKASVIAEKYALLDSLITDSRNVISPALLTSMDSAMANLDTALTLTDYVQASSAVDTLISQVETANGADMDDVWRSSDDIVNVKGELLTRLYTLRYSLRTL